MEIIVSNQDLVAHLLQYLPVKSILRFKSVSKQWYNLLSHPIFIQHHASRSRQTNYSNCVLFLRLGFKSLYLKGNSYHGGLDTVDLRSLLQDSFDQDCLYVITSCNGLLLIEGSIFSLREEEFEIRRFYACNPFTKKHLELDVPDYIAKAPNIIFNLAFDPLKSPHYKVIFFWSDDMTSINYHIAIYSSETRSCKKLGYTFESRLSWLYSGEFLNDAIHWINPLKRTSSYFDINQEMIKVYPMPPHSGPGKGCLYFGKCQGHLNLILGDVKGLRQRVLGVYELKEDYSSWFVKYEIDLEVIAVGFPDIIVTKNKSLTKSGYEYSCLCLMEDDKHEPTLVLLVANQLLAYNFRNKTTKKLCHVQYSCFLNIEFENFRSYWWYKAFQCFENLFGV